MPMFSGIRFSFSLAINATFTLSGVLIYRPPDPYGKFLQACDGSDRSDPHSIAPSAVSASIDPEATQRAALPIGSTWYPRDERDIKGEVLEHQAELVQSGNLQEAAADPKDRKDQGGEESTVVRSSWGENPTGTKSPHGPNPGQRSPAPGSISLGLATLQEKRGSTRYGARDG
ncbi:hypothetical protein NDU88_006868 [Pleurodeles waltl]|uniref:Uncharacterized protein n=1 Tax=Pleurodeles waltl TaxID=8319 RepID=A0AAV7UMA7_PLEWA|nr:hypothetical protein NDU88_006868 [Pleurodeles waltl]